MRSIFRWAGSKRLSLPYLKPFCSQISGRYIEPFAGSACLFFDLEPGEAILGDLNSELIAAFRGLRRDVYRVLECYRRLPKGRNAYYRIRSIDPKGLSDAELSARFLYLNRYSFNGLYRTNLMGIFNVPYGPPKKTKSADQTDLDETLIVKAARLLVNATLLNADFEVTIAKAAPGDFVYLDPPYAINRKRIFNEYVPGSFGEADLERLSAVLKRLDRSGIRFLVSYGDSKEARTLLRDWDPARVPTRRNIAGFVGNRRTAYELVATNFC